MATSKDILATAGVDVESYQKDLRKMEMQTTAATKKLAGGFKSFAVNVASVGSQFDSSADAAKNLANICSSFGVGGAIAGGVVALGIAWYDVAAGTKKAKEQAEGYLKIQRIQNEKLKSDTNKLIPQFEANELENELDEFERLYGKFNRQRLEDERKTAKKIAEIRMSSLPQGIKDEMEGAENAASDNRRAKITQAEKDHQEQLAKQADEFLKDQDADDAKRLDKKIEREKKGREQAADFLKDLEDEEWRRLEKRIDKEKERRKKAAEEIANHQKAMDELVAKGREKAGDEFDERVRQKGLSPSDRAKERREKRKRDRDARSINRQDRIRGENKRRRYGPVESRAGAGENTMDYEQAKAAYAQRNLQQAIASINTPLITTAAIQLK